jgi:membrane associated rhomboid family serine protease
MFLPLHDQNNEPVRVSPVVSYVLIGLMGLVYCYQSLLGMGNPKQEYIFNMRHGVVPAAFLKGTDEYTVSMPVSKKKSRKKKGEKGPDDFLDAFVPTMHIQNSSFWIWLMPLSYIFMHAGWMHLIGNLWFFWIFSDNVEERLGRLLFLVFFLLAGIAGGLLHVFLHADSMIPLVGASGAVSGVMGAYALMFPGNRITSYFCPIWFFIRRIDVSAWMVLGFYILFNFLAMVQTDTASGVAFDCHVGGFLVGVIFGLIFRGKV